MSPNLCVLSLTEVQFTELFSLPQSLMFVIIKPIPHACSPVYIQVETLVSIYQSISLAIYTDRYIIDGLCTLLKAQMCNSIERHSEEGSTECVPGKKGDLCMPIWWMTHRYSIGLSISNFFLSKVCPPHGCPPWRNLLVSDKFFDIHCHSELSVIHDESRGQSSSQSDLSILFPFSPCLFAFASLSLSPKKLFPPRGILQARGV